MNHTPDKDAREDVRSVSVPEAVVRAEGGIPELWSMAYPLIISMAAATLMQFVNRVFLSRYSADALAACVPGGILSFTFVCFFLGTTMYTNAFIAQYYGKRKLASVSIALWQGVILGLLSWVALIGLIPAGLWIINNSSHPPQVKVLEVEYFTILMAGGGFGILNAALGSFFTGRGKTKVTMLVNLGGNILNILLSGILIFGLGPIKSLGITGAGYAFVAGNLFMTLMFTLLIFSRENRELYRTSRLMRFHPKLFLRLLKYGLPNGVGFFLDVASFTVFFFLAGNLDGPSLAANSILATINTMAFMPVLGLGMATLTLVGQRVGQKRHDIAEKTVYNAIRMTFFYVGAISLFFFLCPGVFVNLFGSPDAPQYAAILEKSRRLMRILAIFVLFDGIGIVFSDAIKGAGDTRFQMMTASLCAWLVFVPGSYVCVYVLHTPLEYVWGWACVYVFLLALIFWLRFRSNKWREIDILKH